jgi:hypothetical protein
MTDAPTILSPSKKYCEDCRLCFVPPSGLEYSRCMAPGAFSSDARIFISRKFDAEQHRYASATRCDVNMCGPVAAWFEPKTEAEAA